MLDLASWLAFSHSSPYLPSLPTIFLLLVSIHFCCHVSFIPLFLLHPPQLKAPCCLSLHPMQTLKPSDSLNPKVALSFAVQQSHSLTNEKKKNRKTERKKNTFFSPTRHRWLCSKSQRHDAIGFRSNVFQTTLQDIFRKVPLCFKWHDAAHARGVLATPGPSDRWPKVPTLKA